MANTTEDKIELLKHSKATIRDAINLKLHPQNESLPADTPLSDYDVYIKKIKNADFVEVNNVAELANIPNPHNGDLAIVYDKLNNMNFQDVYYYQSGSWRSVPNVYSATAGKLLEGETALGAAGAISGTIPNNGRLDYTPGAQQQNIPAGYTSGGTIGAVVNENKYVTPSASEQLITPDDGYNGLNQVTVAGDANLISGNIKANTAIFGVTGKSSVVDTEDTNAAAGDIIASKTAYVNGSKITGNIPLTTTDLNYDSNLVAHYTNADDPIRQYDLSDYVNHVNYGNWFLGYGEDGEFYMATSNDSFAQTFVGNTIVKNGLNQYVINGPIFQIFGTQLIPGNTWSFQVYKLNKTNQKFEYYTLASYQTGWNVQNMILIATGGHNPIYQRNGDYCDKNALSFPLTPYAYDPDIHNLGIVVTDINDTKRALAANTNIKTKIDFTFLASLEGASANKIKSGETILGVEGTVIELNSETKTVTPTTSQQIITPTSGKNALSQVTVNAVTNAIDPDIISGNIKNGVDILGVTGVLSEMTETEYQNAIDIADDILGNILPYIKLEYIQSTGTQWIDTNIVPSADTEVEIQVSDVSTNEAILLAHDWSADGFCLSTSSHDKANYIGWHYTGDWQTVSTNRTQLNKIELYRGSIRLNDTQVTTNTNTNGRTYTSTLKLFGGIASHYNSFKLYYLKLYNGETLLRDLIPVKRISDNTICLYDKVSDTFFENQGTGVFTAGPVKS